MTVVFAGANMVSPLWPIYRSELHFNAFVLTIVFAMYVVGVLCGLFVLGGLSDVAGRKPFLIGAVCATIIASLCFAHAAGVPMLLVARFVQGLAVGAMSATANAALNDFAYRENPRHPSIVGSIATSTGFALGPFAAGVLADVAPHPTLTCFIVLIGFSLVAFGALMFVPNSGRRPGAVYRGNAAGVPSAIRPAFLRAALTFAAGWVGGAIYLSLGPSIIVQLLGTSSHAIAGAMLFVFFGASALGQVLFRRIDVATTLRWGDITIGSGVLLTAVAVPLHSLPLFFVAVLVAGAAQGIALLGGLELVNRIAPPSHRGAVLSAFFLAGYVPVAVVVPILGWSADTFGLFPAVIGFALILALCAFGALIDLARWKAPAPATAL